MAEEKKEEQIYDGVGCPADLKSEKTIFRSSQKDPHTITNPDGSKEQRKVLPSHSADHSKVTPGGTPIREPSDPDCGMGGGFDGPVIRRQPPKDQVHPEKKEEKKPPTPGFS